MAETEIKSKVSLGGDKEYKAALRGINQELNLVKSSAAAATSAFDRNDRSVGALTTRSTELARVLETQQKKVALISEKLTAMRESGTGSEEAMNSLQVALNKATADMNKTQLALDSVNAELADASKEAAPAAKKLQQVADAADGGKENLQKFAQGMQALGEAAGKVVMTSVVAGIAAVTAAAAAAGKAPADMAAGVAGYADDISTLSVVTGVGTDTLQRWTYAAELVDISVETITGGMTKITRAAADAAGGSASAQEKFAALGLSIRDGNDELKDAETLFIEAIDALGKVGNATERDAMAMDLFGKSAQQLNPLISAGTDTLRALGREAEETGYVLDAEALAGANAYQDALDRMALAGTGLKNTIGVAAAGVMEPFVTEITDGMTEVTRILQGGGSIEAAVGAAFKSMDAIIPKITAVIDSMVDGLSVAVPQVLGKITGVLTNLVASMAKTLPKLLSNALGVVPDMVKSVTDMFPQIAEDLGSALGDGIVYFISNLPQFVGQLSDMLLSVLNAAVRGLGGALRGIFRGVAQVMGVEFDAIVSTDEVARQALAGYDDTHVEIISPKVDVQPEVTVSANVEMQSIYDGISQYLTDGMADTEEGVEALKEQVKGYYDEQIAKVNAWREEAIAALDTSMPDEEYKTQLAAIEQQAESTITQLQTLSDGTVEWIDANAGRSTASVQANMSQLDSIRQQAETLNGDIARMCGEATASLDEAMTRRAEYVASGSSTDITTNVSALAYEQEAYNEQMEQLRQNAEEARAALYTQVGITDAEITAAREEIDATYTAAEAELTQAYNDDMAAMWQGIMAALGGADAVAKEVESIDFGEQFKAAFMAKVEESGGELFVAEAWTREWLEQNGMTEEDFLGALSDNFKDWEFSEIFREFVQGRIQDNVGGLDNTAALKTIGQLFDFSAEDVVSALPEDAKQTIAAAINAGLVPGVESVDQITMDQLMQLVLGNMGNAENAKFYATMEEAGAEAVSGFGDSFAEGSDAVADAAAGMASGAVDAAESEIGSAAVRPLGVNFAAGIQSGVLSKRAELIRLARQLGLDMTKAYADAQEIKSPSRVMMKMGRYFDEGIIKGIEGGAARVISSVRGLSDSMVGSAGTTGAVPVAAPAAVRTGGDINVSYSGAFTANEARRFGMALSQSMRDGSLAMGG